MAQLKWVLLNTNTLTILTLTIGFLLRYRWIQGVLYKASPELLPEHVNYTALVVHGQLLSVAIWAAGEQRARFNQASPESHLQAFQSQQKMSPAAASPHAKRAVRVHSIYLYYLCTLHSCTVIYSAPLWFLKVSRSFII